MSSVERCVMQEGSRRGAALNSAERDAKPFIQDTYYYYIPFRRRYSNLDLYETLAVMKVT